MTVLARWNDLLRTATWAGLVVVLGWGAWQFREIGQRHEREREVAQQTITGLQTRLEQQQAVIAERDRLIAEQQVQIEELRQENLRLAAALRLLKVDHRLARLKVLAQRPAPSAAREEGRAPPSAAEIESVVTFQELDGAGGRLGPERQFTLQGRVAYVDALVIKFADDFVEQGDALRGTSVCLFRRLFGEFQRPDEGFPLDSEGVRPVAYALDDADPGFESRLWMRFWDFANDPDAAQAAGVRAIHGEAPYIELRAGRSYLVELRASGGLSLRAE